MKGDKKTALFLCYYAALNKMSLMTVCIVLARLSLVSNSVVPLCYMEHFIVYQLIGFGFTASNCFTITKQNIATKLLSIKCLRKSCITRHNLDRKLLS